MVGAGLVILAQLAIVGRAPIDTAQGVNFHALLVPDTVYVGQQATYQVGVFIDDKLRLRLRHNPEFVPPDPQGMLAYELPGTTRLPSVRNVGRQTYEVHVFQRAFFPLSVGQYKIPSAQLVYSLPLSTSFFSREESHTLIAESLSVVARAPPTVGRPADYQGAVGDVTIDARVDSAAARVGDPMLVTLSVVGRGNVKLFPRPLFTVPWGSSVPGQVRVRLDTTSQDVRGTKEFDWLVTPRDSGQLTLPPVRYPFFDPYTDRYEVAASHPWVVHVAPGALALGDTGRSGVDRPLALRTVYRGTPDPPLYKGPGFLAIAMVAPMPGLVLALRRRRARRPRRERGVGAATLQTLARSRQPIPAAAVRRAFVRALDERFMLPPTALTDKGALTHALRLEGVTAAVAQSAEVTLRALDRAAFATGDVASPDTCARSYATYRQIVGEARRQRPRSDRRSDRWITRGTTVAVLVTVASAVAARAILPRPDTADSQSFAAGVAAYNAGNYRAAAKHFAAVTQLARGAPDGWANAGTAAWAIGDSADAVVGWQRAGRLEPLAHDVRERLMLVRPQEDGPIARLPRVPAPLAADIALACWVLACAAATWRVARGPHGLAATAVSCAGAAFLAVALAVQADEMSAARHLVVVDRGAALYASPALDAERGARLDAGDVAAAIASDGAWTHLRLDGDRDGWVETMRLIPLARDEIQAPTTPGTE